MAVRVAGPAGICRHDCADVSVGWRQQLQQWWPWQGHAQVGTYRTVTEPRLLHESMHVHELACDASVLVRMLNTDFGRPPASCIEAAVSMLIKLSGADNAASNLLSAAHMQ